MSPHPEYALACVVVLATPFGGRTHYFKVMTRSDRMPVLVGERI
jgi:hypothetical protein